MEIKGYLSEFRRLRDNYERGIPREIIQNRIYSNVNRNGNRKSFRYINIKDWFSQIYILAEDLMDKEILNGKRELIKSFFEYGESSNLRGRSINPEDIRRANEVLDNIIDSLEVRLNHKRV